MLLTKFTEPGAVKRLLEMAIEDGQRSKIAWPDLEAATQIGYSRAWLLVERELMRINEPQAIINTDEIVRQATEKYPSVKAQWDAAELKKAKAAPKDQPYEPKPFMPLGQFVDLALSKVASAARDEDQDSWGRIAVRMNLPESRVRKLYTLTNNKKDRGLRIGHGGRWVYNDPTLYLENRRKEGAQIPVTKIGRPKPEDLLNYRKPTPVKAAAKRPAAKKAGAAK